MGATKRTSDGETKHVGPDPSTIRVSAPFMSQAAISKRLQQTTAQTSQLDHQERSIAEAREDSVRLQGITWIDTVRRSLQLPIRTYTTACVYYHKFRLAHAGSLNGMEYANAWADACAASLLVSCKVEDTLKKSKDILAAAYNLKTTTHDQVGSDDPIFEAPSRAVIGLERLVLEAGGFDFRSRYPHQLLVKIAKGMPEGVDDEREKVVKLAWTVATDLYRTFAPLKQTTATMALACLELAAHLIAASTENNVSAIRDALQALDLKTWSVTREEVMETLLDLLDLYTQHTAQTILGTRYSLDDFLRVRLGLNKECNEHNLPRHTTAPPRVATTITTTTENTLRVANGHPTPVSPMEPGPQPQPQQAQTTNGTAAPPEGAGTVRFMLNPQRAADEKAQVQKYFVEEWEEYEEEVEIPQPRVTSREPERDRDRRPDSLVHHSRERGGKERTHSRDGPHRERDRPGDLRERDLERDRARARDAERGRGYRGERRFDERDRRVDDRRGRRYDERRYEDDRRRRDDRR
ncbi:cyclin-like protein [Neohortaea acidophila]|uniref:Cyclin-like protein n=1 Tax=Neohortaea acidophila TaxID=245834 RepID=A0A6A6PI29_9PEZI|nr:cyclin-like protein [Neohortaea acidophila]KAF2479698.1 cyclin-like protein [Neohortaea acidophila]